VVAQAMDVIKNLQVKKNELYQIPALENRTKE
jgi:hypothetical protein